jgi:hypothetical protein
LVKAIAQEGPDRRTVSVGVAVGVAKLFSERESHMIPVEPHLALNHVPLIGLVSDHRLAGVLTLVVVVALGTLCGIALFTSRRNGRVISARVRNAVLLLAVAGFAANVWTANVGGRLRHAELGPVRPAAACSIERR